jgi:hypothetical protein
MMAFGFTSICAAGVLTIKYDAHDACLDDDNDSVAGEASDVREQSVQW